MCGRRRNTPFARSDIFFLMFGPARGGTDTLAYSYLLSCFFARHGWNSPMLIPSCPLNVWPCSFLPSLFVFGAAHGV